MLYALVIEHLNLQNDSSLDVLYLYFGYILTGAVECCCVDYVLALCI